MKANSYPKFLGTGLVLLCLAILSCQTTQPLAQNANSPTPMPDLAPESASVSADIAPEANDLAVLNLATIVDEPTAELPTPKRTIYVEVVSFDQPLMLNRLGAAIPSGQMYALKSDVVPIEGKTLTAGNVRLRSDKRPRPIVLRANEGDEIMVTFTNLLTPYSNSTSSADSIRLYNTNIGRNHLDDNDIIAFRTRTRTVGFHAYGMQMVESLNSDGAWAGANEGSMAAPNETKVYRIYAEKEGVYLLFSEAQNYPTGSGQSENGLFGSIIVEPENAEWYRSQVSEADLALAATSWVDETGKTVADGTGLPILDYQAKYPVGHPKAGQYILRMLDDQNHLIYTDVMAIVTGPNAGRFPYSQDSPLFHNVPASPDRRQPFREFSIHYHEFFGTAVQAFPIFYDPNVGGTVGAGGEGFGLNYGSGGIGAEIYSNRINVGPAAECTDCMYEEFFLSSWPLGDPAMVVDVPANTFPTSAPEKQVDSSLLHLFGLALPDTFLSNNFPITQSGQKNAATKAMYPDDPSNVYHSYMRDHVKFRIVHAGTAVPHVHHQHAHQWLNSPNSDNSHYLDSKLINPGSAYTLEMVYNGSGNRNQTVGDQIFHCHFYPHFAAGMWSLWRVHDVFEKGTELDPKTNRPSVNSRALPDAEITNGTPIPGLVPLPTLAMAPIPAKVHLNNQGQVIVDEVNKNPGYPFFIPGVAGKRAPHPPMDFSIGEDGKPMDGGLPRHVILGGEVIWHNESKYDWTKTTGKLDALILPEDGTPIEKAAMAAHATRNHLSVTPEGRSANFVLNGLPPQQGAPYADPAIDDEGSATGTKRVYYGANIQLDVVLNKKGWHYPQQRIITLWEDVKPTMLGVRPPEPLFFRANTGEYIEYHQTNLVPEYYELDDFQVRTPTDILGQHIHLVKFDVTSSDGAANGWNYEDGTFSPDLVRDRIEGINEGRLYTYRYFSNRSVNQSGVPDTRTKLSPTAPLEVWGTPPYPQDWRGAQTTVQRWYADPLLNNKGEDRTIRTVFTHDHFGPSTHQQAGLYAGLLVEPEGSLWYDPVSGEQMGTRSDGGPTSWQANIVTANEEDSYREFALEFQDIALSYFADSKDSVDAYPAVPDDALQDTNFQKAVKNYQGWRDPLHAINPPGSPQLITVGATFGTYSMNYRNEPQPVRLGDPNHEVASTTNNVTTDNIPQAAGPAGNAAFVYQSIHRADNQLNRQPLGGPIRADGSGSFHFPKKPLTPGMGIYDPYTPMIRAYAKDKIQIRTLVGAHEIPHTFHLNGVRWLFEPSFENSGYRVSQDMGISEHFEMLFQMPPTDPNNRDTSFTDYLYVPSTDDAGLKQGLWGLMRSYESEMSDLMPLPNNPPPLNPQITTTGCNAVPNAPVRNFKVAAVSVSTATGGQPLKYFAIGPDSIIDASAIIFVNQDDLDANHKLKDGVAVEPLVLRANAGECIKVNLKNFLTDADSTALAKSGATTTYGNAKIKQSYSFSASSTVGLNPQLLSFDAAKNDGTNVGYNKVQTAPMGGEVNYEWYAGIIDYDQNGQIQATPAEFGSILLSGPDQLEQHVKGLFAALVIEPAGSTWRMDAGTKTSATVFASKSDSVENKAAFREFVVVSQDATSATYNGSAATISAINYKTDPVGLRYHQAGIDTGNWTQFNAAQFDVANAASNSLVHRDPNTPVFPVVKGTPTRMRMVHPGGSGNGEVFYLHGHVWQELPYTDNSTKIGYNPLSQWVGSRDQLTAKDNFEIVLESAGGKFQVPGDYMFRSYPGSDFQNGYWGIMRVTNGADAIVLTDSKEDNSWTLKGTASVNPVNGQRASQVFVFLEGQDSAAVSGPVLADGSWTVSGLQAAEQTQVTIRSDQGGSATYRLDGTNEFVEALKLSAPSLRIGPTQGEIRSKLFVKPQRIPANQ